MTQELARQETSCPACAESILVAAQKCKHCGVDVEEARQRFGNVRCPACAEMTSGIEGRCTHCHEPLPGKAAPRERPRQRTAPLHLERQGSATLGGTTSITATTVEVGFRGDVCPSCHAGTYVKVYSFWHGIIAVLMFPLGLICFAFPIQRCIACRSTFGAGAVMIRVLAVASIVISIGLALLVASVYGLLTNSSWSSSGARAETRAIASAPVSTKPSAARSAVPGPVSLARVALPDSATHQPATSRDSAADIDLSAKVQSEADFSGSGALANGSPPPRAADSDQPYFDFQVEKHVSAIPGQPDPAYPDMLKSANVEGEVLAQFVVDTTGRYEQGTFKVLKSSHELFTRAVKDALLAMQFYPAEVGGRKVKQLVQMPFTFSLTKK